MEYNGSTRPINRRLYLGIFKDPSGTKYKIFKNKQNSYILCFMLKVNTISLKIVKLNPWMGIINPWMGIIFKVAVRLHQKPFMEM